MTERRLRLSSSPRSASTARAFVAEVLAGTPADTCSEVAALLVSELVANAVLHANSPVEVRVKVDETTVRVDVQDRLSRLPVMGEPGDALQGRGLHIVHSLARQWGAAPLPGGGKTVWFEMSAG